MLYVTWFVMCERYVTFVKERGSEVLEWRGKRLTKGFALYVYTCCYLKANLVHQNKCELSLCDLGIDPIF